MRYLILTFLTLTGCVFGASTPAPSNNGANNGTNNGNLDMASDGVDAGGEDGTSGGCGDGVVDPGAGEICEPEFIGPFRCPDSCETPDVCVDAVMQGSPDTCDAECLFALVTECSGGDGCCPNGCDSNTDDDCNAMCGNNMLDEGELCDGDCPQSQADCPPPPPDGQCSPLQFVGQPNNCTSKCVPVEIDECVNNDGCCPQGCDALLDTDCEAACGNRVVEPGEECDGDCPSTSDCDDGNDCTIDELVGMECGRKCEYTLDPRAECQTCNGCQDCPPRMFCDMTGKCADPSDCDQACSPDVFCGSTVGTGSVCQNGSCSTPCMDACDCDSGEACYGGVCTPITSSTQCGDLCATTLDPDNWCAANGGGQCIDYGMGYDCLAIMPDFCCMTCILGACDDAMMCYSPSNCLDACDPDGFCRSTRGGNYYCAATGSCEQI